MTTHEKLIELLITLIKQPIAERIESGQAELIWPPEDKVIPGYDSHLQKIANTLVYKAEHGDIKAIDKIRELIGDLKWPD